MKNARYIIERLADNQGVIFRLVKKLPKDKRRGRPEINKWCIHEIVCHLVDEEKDDFRFRMTSAIHDPGKGVPPIDPEGWVAARKYANMDFHGKLVEWRKSRSKSVKWLKTLKPSDFKKTFMHPEYGTMSAADLLENWLAHDYLHIRQINRYLYEMHSESSQDSLQYAGSW
jgi:hypothetical protein